MTGVAGTVDEVAGLLGITVVGAILTARQSSALHAGHSATDAFLTGYRTGLLVAAVLVALGGLAAFVG
jgi:cation transporter-like permease